MGKQIKRKIKARQSSDTQKAERDQNGQRPCTQHMEKISKKQKGPTRRLDYKKQGFSGYGKLGERGGGPSTNGP